MRRGGKINLGAEDADSDEAISIDALLKPRSKLKSFSNTNAPSLGAFDLSQIKERVLNDLSVSEQVVLTGEEAAAFTDDLSSIPESDPRVEHIKQQRRERAADIQDASEDFMPLDKASFWLHKDTEEQEVEHEKHSVSRLIREDLLYDDDLEDEKMSGMRGYAATGHRLTSAILKRDTPTEEMVLDDDMEDPASSAWEHQQIIKGMDKGWHQSRSQQATQQYYKGQLQLASFEPDPKLPTTPASHEELLSTVLSTDQLDAELHELEANIIRLEQDCAQAQEERLPDLAQQLADANTRQHLLSDAYVAFMRLSLQTDEKLAELAAISAQDPSPLRADLLEHFFDDCELTEEHVFAMFADLEQKFPEEYEAAHLGDSLPLALEPHLRWCVIQNQTEFLLSLLCRMPPKCGSLPGLLARLQEDLGHGASAECLQVLRGCGDGKNASV